MHACYSTIGVVIPTFRAAKHLPHCLPPLLKSKLRPRILVIDSSSDDETTILAQNYGVEVLTIPKTEFNHGTTRERGRKHLNTDIVVMLTQDAYAFEDTLDKLVFPLLKQEASISYARQIPHVGASFFEAFPRSFNYPAESHIRSLQDLSRYGVYTFFCSNSCAAYLNCALDEIEGFQPTLFGEDTVAVAKLLQRGHKIAYVAEAQVRHSHDYSLKQEFRRHFDIGISRRSYSHLIQQGGKDTKRGSAYVKAMLKELKKEAPHLIPYAVLQSMTKLIGYRIGQMSEKAPIWLKKALSSQPAYWQPSGFH
jgi:rhamnosyltransferase